MTSFHRGDEPIIRNNTNWYVIWGGSYYWVLRASHKWGKTIIQEGKKRKSLAIKLQNNI